ncbi:hypothetical protein ACN20G_03995 [Streptomyces sp. BI20]|uniref:hypothetical protein n=1 Tax=Streptomyces sp. BI20 TaxID=3403460 RepID=UPI003C735427
MSQESAIEYPGQPGQAAHDHAQPAPKGLLQQMEELMAALNADLSRLDADLQSSGDRPGPAGPSADRGHTG